MRPCLFGADVKSIDEEQRVFEGIATTPAPDRLGDIVEPLGMKFALPMPLLDESRQQAPGRARRVRASRPKRACRSARAFRRSTSPASSRTASMRRGTRSSTGSISAVSIGFEPMESGIERIEGRRDCASRNASG